MTADLVIRGGLVVDGTGGPPRDADIAIVGGRIAAVGDVEAGDAEVIDAEGCWVTPGFIDPHTHMDAQLCWDPSATPSNMHGVTTVVVGLCGFGVAPCPPDGGEYLLRSLERVEEIPYRSTVLGVPFGWSGWDEYREHVASQPLTVNVAGFVPHSALRYQVMGDRARGETATPEDRAAMVAQLERALAAGAIGVASSRGPNHVDGYGDPVPSRFADDAELQALVAACRSRVWQINVETKFSHDAEALNSEVAAYAEWTRAAGARLTWTPFHAELGDEVWRSVVESTHALNDSGIPVSPQITPLPVAVLIRFDEPSFIAHMRGFSHAIGDLFELDADARKARLSDPAVRAQIGPANDALAPRFDEWTIVGSPTRPDLVGRTVAEVADAQRADPVELLCDLVVADDLGTLLQVMVANRNRSAVLDLLHDDRMLVGLGDSGAHVMSITNYRYPTTMLTELVGQGDVSLELAVHRMTGQPADFLGLDDRGVLRPGLAADICVVDPDCLALEPLDVAHDLPGGAPRLHQVASGYRHVLVNGAQTIVDDTAVESAAGVVLSAGDRPSSATP